MISYEVISSKIQFNSWNSMFDAIILVFDEKYLNIWESDEMVWQGHKLGELGKLRKKMGKSMNLQSYMRFKRFIGLKLV
ncbi:unnamed protein product [Paramecium octaurelia]|uniref:Uncharacterized protein n=1 Tax=Paramecium octaurelia TaxID=43137 RepID=A0A8S1XEC6_PAROT|nr:unnamed protein product [Paramecium octaurelia]